MSKFTKMHGTGNDFVLVDGITNNIDLNKLQAASKNICDRHFGIGADGVIAVLSSNNSDLQMRIFNADGSEAEMCGNGLRCFSFFAFHSKLITNKTFTVETLAGQMIPEIIESNSNQAQVKINMGKPFLLAKDIPVEHNRSDLLNIPLQINNLNLKITPIGMGNPHAVIFVDNLNDFPVCEIGPLLEKHPLFPNKTNVEFVEVITQHEAKMRVWERGSGETLSCGTGTCASVVAGNLLNKLSEKVTVHLLGGDLSIEWKNKESIYMTGAANIVFEGQIQFS